MLSMTVDVSEMSPARALREWYPIGNEYDSIWGRVEVVGYRRMQVRVKDEDGLEYLADPIDLNEV